MALPLDEPTDPQAMSAWIAAQAQTSDRFRHVAQASNEHRRLHGCTIYPSSDGPLHGLLAGATGATRLLEVGCGLGYSALWLAYAAGPKARVETVERDPQHVELAQSNFRSAGLDGRITVLVGQGAVVLPRLEPGYDLIYFDAEPSEALLDLEHFEGLLRPGGLLISANLFLGVGSNRIPGLEMTARYRQRILDGDKWLTAFMPNGKALSLRR